MDKKKYFFLFLLLFLLPANIKAACSVEEKVRLKSLASNINFSYKYVMRDNGSVRFDITISNLHPDLYINDKYYAQTIYYNDAKEITINEYDPGISIQYDIVSNYGACQGEKIFTNYVTLPSYNYYYNDPLCEGIEDYSLCKKWSTVSLTHEQFESNIQKYKDSLKKETKKQEEIKEEEDVFLLALDFLARYNLFIFGGIIIICSVLIYYLKRKDDFDLKTK